MKQIRRHAGITYPDNRERERERHSQSHARRNNPHPVKWTETNLFPYGSPNHLLLLLGAAWPPNCWLLVLTDSSSVKTHQLPINHFLVPLKWSYLYTQTH
jgi:hypothetical protein